MSNTLRALELNRYHRFSNILKGNHGIQYQPGSPL
jgi:hypothetical protein